MEAQVKAGRGDC